MWKYTVKRILWMIPVLLGISIVIFTIMYFCPGDPAVAILGNGATPAAIEAKRIEMGFGQALSCPFTFLFESGVFTF